MTEAELSAVVRGIAPVLKQYVEKAVADLVVRLTVAETQAAAVGELRDRLVAVETKSLLPAPDVTADLRERVAMVETRAAQPHPLEPAFADVRERLAALERRVSDDVQSKDLAGLRERVAVLETKAPVPGPPGMDGKNGVDGQDGLSVDDLSVEFDGERTLSLKFHRGTVVKVFHVELTGVPLYRGVWLDGKAYDPGDMVTWGGSLWHAREATVLKPGDGVKAWTLAVKRGSDGKDLRDPQPNAGLPVVKIGGRR